MLICSMNTYLCRPCSFDIAKNRTPKAHRYLPIATYRMKVACEPIAEEWCYIFELTGQTWVMRANISRRLAVWVQTD